MTFKVEERETEEEEESFVSKSDEENVDESEGKGSEENEAVDEGAGCRVLGGSFEGESESEVCYRVGWEGGRVRGQEGFCSLQKHFIPANKFCWRARLCRSACLNCGNQTKKCKF